MEQQEKQMTHKGWLGCCPVYLDDIETDCPTVVERHWLLVPLLNINLWIFGAGFLAMSILVPGYEVSWPLKITGELKKEGGE